MRTMLQNVNSPDRGMIRALSPLSLLGAILVWSYGPTLLVLMDRWSSDATYSHGFLVPLVAAALIWHRRALPVKSSPASNAAARTTVAQAARLRGVADAGEPPALRKPGLGLAVIAGSVALRLIGARFYFEWLEWLSILPSVAGLCVLHGGCLSWRRAWPGIVFLAFMLPLPYRLEIALAGPLQNWATFASTYLLQTAGYPAVAEGNVILVHEARVGVAEACSGLRMLVAFFAVSTAVACFIRRPAWERGLVILSAVPIAVICNVTRVTVTAALYESVGSKVAHVVFHDLAGWLMMPMAVALLSLELWVLSRLLIAPPERDVVPVLGLGGSRMLAVPGATIRPAISKGVRI